MAEPHDIVDLIAKHLPPSAERVRVQALDDAAREWARLLTDRHAATVCDAGRCDAALGTTLAVLPRVSLRRGGRAIFLLAGETRSLPDLTAVLQAAGFHRLLTEPVLEGGYVLVRGELAVVADRESADAAPGGDWRIGSDTESLPRYLHLLVHQQPPSRSWEHIDPESITWEALTVRDVSTGERLLLGFSSLVKAVAFMKPAALAGAVPEVNKLPRYRGEVAAGWALPVLLDAAFERLRQDARYTLESEPVQVDPRLEDKLRE